MSLTEQPRACPSCTAANRPDRELCARCGADLDTGVVPPRPVRTEAPDPPQLDRAPVPARRWLLPLVAVVVVAGLLVAGLSLAGLGPLARTPEVPPATFAQERYAGDPARLQVTDVATRTTGAGPDVEAPDAMLDGDPTTAWRSSGPATAEEGDGEVIDLVLDAPAWVRHLELRNGDQLDTEALAASSRLSTVRLTFDGGVVLEADLLDLGLQAQQVVLPEPVLTTEVRIDVLEVFPGDDPQIAVSDVAVVGWPADGEDADVAVRRAEVEPASGAAALSRPE